ARAGSPLAYEERLLSQFAQGNGNHPFPPAGGWDDEHEALGSELLGLQMAVYRMDSNEPKIDLCGLQILQDQLAVAHGETQTDPGMGFPIIPDQGREQVLPGDRAGADHQAAFEPIQESGHPFL